MPRFVYNKQMIQFIRDNYPNMFLADLVVEFNKRFGMNKTLKQLKSVLSNHDIKAGVRRNRTPRKYLDHHLAFLQERYQELNLDQLTDAFNAEFPRFNADVNSIRACLRNHQIRSGRTGRFEEGQEGWNKGMKGLNTGGEKGWFKKGAVPLNWKPIGSERINVYGYPEIKVANPKKWEAKQRVVWERAKGPIPPKHIIIFKDGNPLNCELDNLMMITKAQSVVMNKQGLQKAPPEMMETAALVAELQMKAKKVA